MKLVPGIKFLLAIVAVLPFCGYTQNVATPICPGNPEWPRAWVSYREWEGKDMAVSAAKDFANMKAHGVTLVSMNARSVEDAKVKLALARKYGMKFHIQLNKMNEREDMMKEMALQPVDALMIGGIYKGRAIDRFLFEFTPNKQSIIIEQPVYNAAFAYRSRKDTSIAYEAREQSSHYFPDVPAPVKAEIIVPEKLFDGKQHVRIVPATIEVLTNDTILAEESVTSEMRLVNEIKNRMLYKITFDLTGLDNALLNKVGVAVYWPYHGSDKWYVFGHGTVSMAAETSHDAARRDAQKQLQVWKDANGGTFPLDVVIASRMGDEHFYITSHLYEPNKTVNFPLWDYSEPALQVFKKNAGTIQYPRTWGYPEIYGADAYAWWLYTLHENSAGLIKATVDAAEKIAPGILLFRNTTRAGVFSLANDHDGSGPELLTQQMNTVHLDPYPVGGAWWGGTGYRDDIIRDMSYYSGLARRYKRLLVPWMQAHIYGGPTGLQHVTPEQVKRMGNEQYAMGVDAVMWLGYGPSQNNTFPLTRPESWEAAGKFHQKLINNPPPKPKMRLAVLRSYKAWALTSYNDTAILNPQDWLLQQWLEVWSVQNKQPYDVFEIPPVLNAQQRNKLENDLKQYKYVVGTITYKNAWVIGADAKNAKVKPADDKKYQEQFKKEIAKKGWMQLEHK